MKEIIQKAITVLNEGGVILYPTDTVWGLGCDATNKIAVDRLFLIKKRMEDKSVIVLVDNFKMLQQYAENFSVDSSVLNLSLSIPTTFILPKGKNMVKGVINQNGSAAFRVPKHLFCEELLKEFKKPLVSTSANISGDVTPYFYEEIKAEIKELVDFIVPKDCEGDLTHKPSRILAVKESGELLVVRE